MAGNGADMKSRDASAAAAAISVDSAVRVPLATQIARQITWQVATGLIPAGSFLPVMSELAAQLGVNVHTVRAAYRQLAEDGIVLMARGARTRVLGYDRLRALAGYEPHRSFTIGVMVSQFDIFYNEYLEALSRAAEVEGWLPIICQTQNYDPAVVARYLDQLFSRDVDGIILIRFETLGDEELIETLRSSAGLRPFVLVDCADIGVGSRIDVDHASTAHMVTEHLIGHGHVRIGHVGAPEGRSSAIPFRSGYERALAEAGLPSDDRLIEPVTSFYLAAGAKAAMRLLQSDDPPTAVMCASDAVAFGVIAAARELGMRVPDDLAVMGYGELPLSRLAVTPLATVHISPDQFAYEAVRTLRRAIDEGEPQPSLTIRPSLVPRESCGCTSH
ncbi:MAG: GntR family transcriptional regulator [bacterium]|nr:GntR family transcriptional regulator [bacterium]